MLRESVINNLSNCILPFWEGMMDPDFGGFYGMLDFDLKLDKKAVKGCILNSRILWFFSNVYLTTKDASVLPYADHAFEFLKTYCIDRENGGIYWSMTYDGKIDDSTKHTYNQAFAIYALASYYDATGHREALDLAMDLFHVIETKCRLGDGYGESYTMDFVPNVNDKLSENNVIADKTMNTLLHVCEAYTELQRVAPNEEVWKRLYWTVDEFYNSVYCPERHRLEVFFDSDMNSILDLHSYGHDIEATWLLDRALDVLGDRELSDKLAPMILDLTEQIYQVAYEDHSVMAEAEKGVVLTTRIWWVQCESIIGFYNAYQKTRDMRYLDAAENIWTYIEEHLLDPREGSEWYYEVDADGVPSSRLPIVEPWKCPYHNGRMCMEIMRRTAFMDPINKNATKEARTLLRNLYKNAGKRLITGQHTQAIPMEERTHIHELTGCYPKLQGFELLSYSSNINYEDMDDACRTEIEENKNTVETALNWAKESNGIVSFCFHWFSPIGGRDKAFYTRNTDFSPYQVLIEGTEERAAFFRDLDLIADQLARFQIEHIPVLWRPFHESEDTWFWWASKGPKIASELYKLMYHYFTDVKHLNNLIWVWSCPAKEGYPGDDYVDIVSWDIYVAPHTVTDYKEQYEELTANTSREKLAALSEVGVIPDITMIRESRVPWSYFMTWSKEFCLTEEHNYDASLKALYASDYTIKLGESL